MAHFWKVAASGLVGGALGLMGTPAERLRPLAFEPFDEDLAAFGRGRSGEVDRLVAGLPAGDLAALLVAGRLTAVELVLHHLERIRRWDGSLRSVIELNPAALAEAAASDARRATGSSHGTMDGLPVLLKDNIETAGPMRTTCGAVVLADHVASRDAPLVSRLKGAGAVVLGKANLSELAGASCRIAGVSAVGGQTRNPYGWRFTPGGSSSGSAVAVAAGLCAVSVGTETSGSLIAPCAFNGVVGLKPSAGAVSGDGIIPLVRFQDSAGPIGRCVADAAALFQAMTEGPAVDLSADSLRGVRVGVLEDDIRRQPAALEDTSDNPDLLVRIRTGLAGAGADARPVVLPAAAKTAFEHTFTRVVFGGVANDTMRYLAGVDAPATTTPALMGYNLKHPRRRMPKGQFFLGVATALAVKPADYERAALAAREQATAVLDEAFTGVDLLVSLGNLHSSLYATANFPAVSVPVGLRANGMPAGATLIARPGADSRLLSWAFAFEQATGLRVAPALAGR